MTQAQIIRHGAALAIDRGEATEVVRRKDIAALPPVSCPSGDRFTEVELVGDTLTVRLRSGLEADIDLDARGSASNSVVAGCRVLTGLPNEAGGLEVIDDAAILLCGDSITWIGSASELSSALAAHGVERFDRYDGEGKLLTPGLVDCHAHPIFAGDRGDEFAMRARGDSYLAIAAAGGGIVATTTPTRAASTDDLIALAFGRGQRAAAAGTTTMEAKSGYDLTPAGELRLLEVALAADGLSPIDFSPTLLGAHVLPPEYENRRGAYVEAVIDEMIPAAATGDLATAVDVYCDEGAFTLAESEAIWRAGRAAGLDVRGHVGQFADLGGAEALAALGARSADHLEEVSATGIADLAAAGVVAVMLPGACVQLGQKPPSVAALREAGVPLAVATDLNPGSFHGELLPIAMWLAVTHYGMTVEECWLGVTSVAARVLGRDRVGVIRPGARADLVLWDTDTPAAIPYCVGRNLVCERWLAGRRFTRSA